MTYFIPNFTIPPLAFGIRPAAMGTRCDAYYTNPDFTPDGDEPLLIRCKAEATIKALIVDSAGYHQAKKQCPACAEILRQKRNVVILMEEEL